MSADLPELARDDFSGQLTRVAGRSLEAEALERLWIHYTQLARWNRRLSLIGPGTVADSMTRHYAESLAGLAFFEPEDRVVVDIGSGAGFPGWVLAAARPDLDMTLVESRQRKWSFLAQTSQKAALPCHCLNARVTAALPEGFPSQVDLVLMRAVRLGEKELSALVSGLSRRGRLLLWSGPRSPLELPGMAEGRSVAVAGSEGRRIVEWVQDGARGAAS